jgi:Chlorophyll A-B binding protein
LDQLFLDEDQFGPILYGPVTLPYFPLLLTLIMLLLGYLDIYAKVIQEEEKIGDAFLPGDCFWDPLRILEGAPPSMKRNMQEREIINGRMAMIAFAAFVFEEAASHRALVTIPSNELLFEPLYQVSFVQEWLDQQFSNYH